jgi:hypothetical protein
MNRFRRWYGIAVILISTGTFVNQIKCIQRAALTLHTLLPRGFGMVLAVLSFLGGLLLMKSGGIEDSKQPTTLN